MEFQDGEAVLLKRLFSVQNFNIGVTSLGARMLDRVVVLLGVEEVPPGKEAD